MILKNKKIVVFGFGKTGFEVAKFLLERGANVFITDKEESQEKYENIKKLHNKVEYEFGKHSSSFIKGSDLIIISPGVDERILPAIVNDEKVPVLSEIELAYIFSPSKKIIAITGTNGKTTTTLLTGNIFKYSGNSYVVCGNVGNPFIGEIENIDSETFVILEVSSFQLEKIKKFRPYIGVILNIADDHFDRYKDLAEYIEAKKKIFLNKEENNWAVLNGDDEICLDIASQIPGNKMLFGFSSGFDVYFKEGLIISGDEKIVDIRETNLVGKGNIYNCLAAVSIAIISDIDRKAIRKGIEKFTPPEHRMEKVREIKGVVYINDSKSTNPHSVKNALESLPDRRVILLMGGLDKGLSFSSLKNLIEKKTKLLILFGQARDKIERQLKISGKLIKKVETLKQAVLMASENAKKGDIVLLSPGCASFDQFKDYKERGNVFKEQVKNLL